MAASRLSCSMAWGIEAATALSIWSGVTGRSPGIVLVEVESGQFGSHWTTDGRSASKPPRFPRQCACGFRCCYRAVLRIPIFLHNAATDSLGKLQVNMQTVGSSQTREDTHDAAGTRRPEGRARSPVVALHQAQRVRAVRDPDHRAR